MMALSNCRCKIANPNPNHWMWCDTKRWQTIRLSKPGWKLSSADARSSNLINGVNPATQTHQTYEAYDSVKQTALVERKCQSFVVPLRAPKSAILSAPLRPLHDTTFPKLHFRSYTLYGLKMLPCSLSQWCVGVSGPIRTAADLRM